MRRVARISGTALSILMTLALLSACTRPTHDSATLQSIQRESAGLMAAYPRGVGDLPKNHWPRTIAGLHPAFVIVSSDEVEIVVKPYLDGGYGYLVPRDRQRLPEPKGRFSKLGTGIYWYHPY